MCEHISLCYQCLRSLPSRYFHTNLFAFFDDDLMWLAWVQGFDIDYEWVTSANVTSYFVCLSLEFSLTLSKFIQEHLNWISHESVEKKTRNWMSHYLRSLLSNFIETPRVMQFKQTPMSSSLRHIEWRSLSNWNEFPASRILPTCQEEPKLW